MANKGGQSQNGRSEDQLVEAFMNERVALTFRWYDGADYEISAALTAIYV